MESTTSSSPASGRSSRASGRGVTRELERDAQYDLLTAALLGVAVGAGAALLIGAGVRRERPGRVRKVVRRGTQMAGRGRDAMVAAPAAARDQMHEYMEAARDAIADTVEAELRDLRKAARRQRKRFGV